jgi:hypothetical protein
VIHHRAVVVVLVLLAIVVPVVPLVVVPALMLQTPSCSMMLIGTAPLRAKVFDGALSVRCFRQHG